MPRRFEHDVGMNFPHRWQLRQFALDIGPQHVSHAAAGCGHGHVDFDLLAAFNCRDLTRIDESQIHHVDRDFGIENRFQLVPNQLFAELDLGWLWVWLGCVSQRISVLSVAAHHLAVFRGSRKTVA